MIPDQATASQAEAELPLGDAGRAALAVVMRRYDEKQQAQRAATEAHVRTVLSEREQARAPLLPEADRNQSQP